MFYPKTLQSRSKKFTYQNTESRSPIIFMPSFIFVSFSPTIRISKYVMNCDNAITMYNGIRTRNATIQSARIIRIKLTDLALNLHIEHKIEERVTG